MAGGRIKGITIEIGGDTTNLQKSLSSVDKSLRQTQNNLKDVNKLLKLDPGNTELLIQKQKNLKEAISLTKDRLQQLKDAQAGVEKGTAEWDALQREIIATEQDLKGLEDEYRSFGSVASQKLKAVSEKIGAAGAKITEFGQKLAPVSAAAAAFGGALLKLGYDSVKSADELNTLSKQTGISTDELQKMQYAADLVDVSVEDITGALKKMKPKMKESNDTFKKLGVSVTNADGSLRDATDVFYDSVVALSKIENETERDQVAMELFGKGADQLAGIIDDGGEAFKAYGKEAEEMGLILDGDTLDALNKTNDTIDKTKATVAATAAKIGADVAGILSPALEKAAAYVEQLAAKFRSLTPEQQATILKITAIVAAAAPLIMVIGSLVSGISGVVAAIGFLFSPMGLIVAAIAAVVAAGVLLYQNWDKVCEWAKKLKKNVVDAWNGTKKEVSKCITDLKTWIVNGWNNIKTSVTNAVNSVKNAIVNAWNTAKTSVINVTENMRSMLAGKLDAIKAKYQEHGGGIKGLAAAAVEAIKQKWTLGFDALNTLTGGKLNGIKQKFTTAYNGVKSTVQNAISSLRNTISNGMSAIDSMTGGRLSSLRNKFSSIFSSVRSTVSNAISSIRSMFNFSWHLPHLKLPHVSIQGSFSLMPPQVPKFSIQWYKKAMHNPVLFTSPTVLGTPSGLKGFGDAGAEIVMGLDRLQQLAGTDARVVPVLLAMNEKLDALNSRPIYLNSRELTRSLKDLGVAFA